MQGCSASTEVIKCACELQFAWTSSDFEGLLYVVQSYCDIISSTIAADRRVDLPRETRDTFRIQASAAGARQIAAVARGRPPKVDEAIGLLSYSMFVNASNLISKTSLYGVHNE